MQPLRATRPGFTFVTAHQNLMDVPSPISSDW